MPYARNRYRKYHNYRTTRRGRNSVYFQKNKSGKSSNPFVSIGRYTPRGARRNFTPADPYHYINQDPVTPQPGPIVNPTDSPIFIVPDGGDPDEHHHAFEDYPNVITPTVPPPAANPTVVGPVAPGPTLGPNGDIIPYVGPGIVPPGYVDPYAGNGSHYDDNTDGPPPGFTPPGDLSGDTPNNGGVPPPTRPPNQTNIIFDPNDVIGPVVGPISPVLPYLPDGPFPDPNHIPSGHDYQAGKPPPPAFPPHKSKKQLRQEYWAQFRKDVWHPVDAFRKRFRRKP